MRHAPFPIGEQARDAWLRNMRRALDSLDLPLQHEKLLWDYLTSAADSLRNLPG
jgi:hemoglobin